MSSTPSGDDDAAAPSAPAHPGVSANESRRPWESSSQDRDLTQDWIAGAPHPIVVTHGPTHVLRQANPAFCRLMNVDPGTILRRPYAEALPEPAGEGPLPLLNRVFTSGVAEADRELSRFRAAGGHAVWSCTVWPLGAFPSDPTGLVMEVRDRTHEAEQVRGLNEMAEQVRLINERLLRSAIQEQEWAEKAEAGAKAKSDFLSMMSHELRTPLSGIVGYAEVMLSGISGPVSEKQYLNLQRIQTCSDHLVQMIDDVLAYAQVEAQSVQFRPEPVDLYRLAREAAAIVEPLAAKKGLRLETDFPAGSLRMETDPQKVRQILLNLMGNAVKFTDDGEVRLELVSEPDGVSLRVRDTGIGIGPQDLERVFDPFVQSEAVTTRRFGGTGLGLPISRSLAELLGGELTAESTLGRGSTFVLRLPGTSPSTS